MWGRMELKRDIHLGKSKESWVSREAVWRSYLVHLHGVEKYPPLIAFIVCLIFVVDKGSLKGSDFRNHFRSI